MTDPTMRDAFFNELYEIAKGDKRVVLLTADCGAPALDRYRQDLSGQYVNVGIAEQNMVSVAAGLALEGKRPFCYAIAPFASLRCLEQTRVDLCMMGLPVTIVAVGAGCSYDLSGPTHHAVEDIAIMRALPLTVLCPSDSIMASAFAHIAYLEPGPKYIRLDRERLPDIYGPDKDFSQGLARLESGMVTIIATGWMVHQALATAENFGVVDLYRLKPVNVERLLEVVRESDGVVTLEEHHGPGGLGSIVAELMADAGIARPLLRLKLPDIYCFEYGGRGRLHTLAGLGPAQIAKSIKEWIQCGESHSAT